MDSVVGVFILANESLSVSISFLAENDEKRLRRGRLLVFASGTLGTLGTFGSLGIFNEDAKEAIKTFYIDFYYYTIIFAIVYQILFGL
jgi:Rad3-related DNA helicase